MAHHCHQAIIVSRLVHAGLGRMPRCRLPACASDHERPDDESERSWEGLKQVEEVYLNAVDRTRP